MAQELKLEAEAILLGMLWDDSDVVFDHLEHLKPLGCQLGARSSVRS